MSNDIRKQEILFKLANDDKALIWSIVQLNKRQTSDEQATQNTRHHNGRGFRPCHARMGTSMAQFYQRNGYLSQKQIAYWRKPMKNSSMKIGIYWAQLAEAADDARKAKEAAKITG